MSQYLRATDRSKDKTDRGPSDSSLISELSEGAWNCLGSFREVPTLHYRRREDTNPMEVDSHRHLEKEKVAMREAHFE
jgi:hypothetical protein